VVGRPIVALYNYLTTPLAREISNKLQSILRSHFEAREIIVEGPQDVSRRLHQWNQYTMLDDYNDYVLCTADFATLYTSLPHVFIMDSLKALFNYFNIDEKGNDLLCQIEVYLQCTYFHEPVTDRHYHQNIGIPMGGNCSPAIANAVLLWHDIRLMTKFNLIFRMRYLDDICMLYRLGQRPWEHYPNEIKLNIVQKDTTTVDFLNFTISIKNKGKGWKFGTDLYSKPGNAFEYLLESANVPRSARRGVILGICHMLACVCDNYERYKYWQQIYRHLLEKRQYNSKFIDQIFKQVSFLDLRSKIINNVVKEDDDQVDMMIQVPYVKNVTFRRDIIDALEKSDALVYSNRLRNTRIVFNKSAHIGSILNKKSDNLNFTTTNNGLKIAQEFLDALDPDLLVQIPREHIPD
nr:hypothetical protein [Nitrosopumilus sp.]